MVQLSTHSFQTWTKTKRTIQAFLESEKIWSKKKPNSTENGLRYEYRSSDSTSHKRLITESYSRSGEQAFLAMLMFTPFFPKEEQMQTPDLLGVLILETDINLSKTYCMIFSNKRSNFPDKLTCKKYGLFAFQHIILYRTNSDNLIEPITKSSIISTSIFRAKVKSFRAISVYYKQNASSFFFLKIFKFCMLPSSLGELIGINFTINSNQRIACKHGSTNKPNKQSNKDNFLIDFLLDANAIIGVRTETPARKPINAKTFKIFAYYLN
ncbi:hypothetical protein BpHYR1_006917 [Brachionus plicatilis]|uniref:Uncharacterized protein n=1 Tax=Brachionus plicatilis TaxID=10195 RepID=A0A3M7QSX6_BRAPC|nr:hypothetical protein BpHYR1_006917 [Brachionus plicatilis]